MMQIGKFLSSVLISVSLIQPLAAQEDALSGCWARDYSDAHLTDHPAQVVDEIRINFAPLFRDSQPWANLRILAANQGHAAENGQGGQEFAQTAACFHGEDGWSCGVECDGGGMDITRLDGDTLEFTTEYFMTALVGDDPGGCGGNTLDLAEAVGERVTYRLSRASADACAFAE